MGACLTKANEPREHGQKENTRGKFRQCSSLLERDLVGEEKVLYMTRHHKIGLFDIPYRLRAGGIFPRISQTTKDIIDASKDDIGEGRKYKRKQNIEDKGEDWMQDVAQRYQLISTLGMGGTSTVWLGKDIKNGKEVAIKLFKRPIAEDNVPMLYNELMVGSQLWFDDTFMAGQAPQDSIFLCHTRSIFLTRHCYGVVMDVARGGNLAEYVSATCGKHVTPAGDPCHLAIDEEQARFIFRQILEAIRYLHTNMHTAHRDIKLDNTVIVHSWTESKSIGTPEHCVGRVECIDFQYAYQYGHKSPMIRCKDLLGTPVYMSPELLAVRFETRRHKYDPVASDIWAIGIMLVAMLFGTFPFDDSAPKTMEDLERSIYSIQKASSWKQAKGIAPFLKFASPGCIDLLDCILQVDPSKRYSLSQIEMHPWVRKPFESKSLESGWNSIQKEIKEHKELSSSSLSAEQDIRRRIASMIYTRNDAVRRLIGIASHPYDGNSSIFNQDAESAQSPKSPHEWHVFCNPEIAGIVDHHSFLNDQSLEISMSLEDAYNAVTIKAS